LSSNSALDEHKNNDRSRRSAFFPELVVMLGTVATATAAIMIRFAQEEVSSLAIATWRMCLATLILAPLAVLRYRHELKALRRNQIGYLACSGLFLAAHFATWISSLEFTSVASAVVLVATNPLWVALFSWLFLKEKISRQVTAGMLVALLGGVLISLGDISAGGLMRASSGSNPLWGDLLALLGGVFGAGYIIIGRKMRAFTSLPVYTFSVYGVAGGILLITVLLARLPLTGYQPGTYLWLLLLAVIPQVLGHSSINWGLKYLPAAFVAVVMLSEPVGSSILAVFLLDEIPTSAMIIGGVLILLGIGLASWVRSSQTALEIDNGN
jgi:drug/metabolite transporter (DMT)-like permease